MRILALDSSTKTGSAALLDGESVVGEYILNVAMTHSERLLPAIERIMADAGWTGEDLGGIAVTLGPGSFTGLRIGMTTAKILAYLWNISLAGVPTLDALARQGELFAGLVCPLLDARRGEVYGGIYREGRTLKGPLNVPVGELLDCLPPGEQVLFLGDGAGKYWPIIQGALGERAVLAPGPNRILRASFVGLLGQEKLIRGEEEDPMTLTPFYLRRSEAEIKWGRMCDQRTSD
ncbi:MAG: tRNA (adenosine(37)-N6)-threonylcarbamoyltransferase complex dimerization subunit type 1 TsaB [Firmicutes bacterium]|nr:tRNA (adenosine(37)-N6)-threonylcarbamoyltransferase complex dimerization subunit type 1 TsaB [Bacillota bacterium]